MCVVCVCVCVCVRERERERERGAKVRRTVGDCMSENETRETEIREIQWEPGD